MILPVMGCVVQLFEKDPTVLAQSPGQRPSFWAQQLLLRCAQTATQALY